MNGLPGVVAALALALLPASASPAQAADRSAATNSCNAPAPDAVSWVDLPGKLPFQALPTSEGCTVFVSLPVGDAEAPDDHPDAALAVFRRSGGRLELQHTLHLGGNPTGMALTHDGRWLIVADGVRLAFLDAVRASRGAGGAILGYWRDANGRPGRVQVAVSPDDSLLFVSNEGTRTVTVLDLASARRDGPAGLRALGEISVGFGPVAVVPSPDGRTLYVTTLLMPPSPDWPAECHREWLNDPRAQPIPQGGVFVVDVERARRDPATAVVAVAKGGCTPVRLVLSPDGRRAYVTARGGNALHVFDTARLRSSPQDARIATVPTGSMPIGVAVVDGGRRVVVTNSNRFGADAAAAQSLLVIDAARVEEGAAAVLGHVDAAALPREMRLTADGRTLLVVNTTSRRLQVLDLARLDSLLRN